MSFRMRFRGDTTTMANNEVATQPQESLKQEEKTKEYNTVEEFVVPDLNNNLELTDNLNLDLNNNMDLTDIHNMALELQKERDREIQPKKEQELHKLASRLESKGEQGPKGEKGDTGLQGPKGERGEQGERGLTLLQRSILYNTNKTLLENEDNLVVVFPYRGTNTIPLTSISIVCELNTSCLFQLKNMKSGIILTETKFSAIGVTVFEWNNFDNLPESLSPLCITAKLLDEENGNIQKDISIVSAVEITM